MTNTADNCHPVLPTVEEFLRRIVAQKYLPQDSFEAREATEDAAKKRKMIREARRRDAT